MKTQAAYQKAIKYAATKHGEGNQLVPGSNLPYLVHVCNVTMEVLVASKYTDDFDEEFAITVALLHDTVEDTSATYEEVAELFGTEVSEAVRALTKDDLLPKPDRMADSLRRINELRNEVGAVKLADRITNMQPPPKHWTIEKCKKYQGEAKMILKELGHCNKYLADRLEEEVEKYGSYINVQ